MSTKPTNPAVAASEVKAIFNTVAQADQNTFFLELRPLIEMGAQAVAWADYFERVHEQAEADRKSRVADAARERAANPGRLSYDPFMLTED